VLKSASYPYNTINDKDFLVRNFGCHFGFNGKENDNEIKGAGNSQDFGARIYDNRLGRWLSVDPLEAKYPFMSPFTFVANNPLIAIDPDGKIIKIVGDIKTVTKTFAQLQSLTSKQLVLLNDGTVAEAHKLNDLQKTMVIQSGIVSRKNYVSKESKAIGTKLIIDAIDNERIIEIKPTNYYENEDITKYNNIKDASNGVGTGSEIYHDPDDDGIQSDPHIKNEDGSEGRSPIINLAHEIRHALNGLLGKRLTGNSGKGDPDNLKTNGKTFELSKEEASTREFEQKISVEQDEPIRASPLTPKK